MSKTDKNVRLELSALYRILHMYGMTDLANQCAGARSIENSCGQATRVFRLLMDH